MKLAKLVYMNDNAREASQGEFGGNQLGPLIQKLPGDSFSFKRFFLVFRALFHVSRSHIYPNFAHFVGF
jgi:hypothetical protein